MSISLLLANDNTVLMKGLASQLKKEKNLTIITSAESTLSILDIIIQRNPDIFIYDIDHNGEQNGFPLLREIRRTCGDNVHVIALSDHEDVETYGAFFNLGGWGYELKKCRDEEITLAIRRICLGKHFICSSIGGEFIFANFRDYPPIDSESLKMLTHAERKVVVLAKEGYTVKEIAIHLRRAVKTIEKHFQRIMGKLDIHNNNILRRRMQYTKLD